MNPKISKRIISTIKIVTFVATYAFLIYKLGFKTNWEEISHSIGSITTTKVLAIVFLLALTPLNWLVEAKKWQLLIRNVEPLTIKKSLTAVLAALCTGVITPNRTGEWAGRAMLLHEHHRGKGVMAAFYGSLAQNVATAFAGGIAAVLYFGMVNPADMNPNPALYKWPIFIITCSALVFFFLLPSFFTWWHPSNVYFRKLADTLAQYSHSEMVAILGVSVLKLSLYSLQFYIMLFIFGTGLTVFEGFAAIPLYFLLVSFVPVFSFTEPGVRGAVAYIVFTPIVAIAPATAVASVVLWIVNIALPTLVGSVYWIRNR